MSEEFEIIEKTNEILESEKQVFEQFVLTTSAESFSALYSILYPRLIKYYLARKTDMMASEELTQNVLLTVYEKISDLKTKENFYGWLYKIARNEWLNYLTKEQRRNSIVKFEPLDDEHVPLNPVNSDSPFSFRFYEWMGALSKDEQEIIMLRYIDGLSYEELAEAIQIPVGTVKSRISNAKKKLAGAINLAE